MRLVCRLLLFVVLSIPAGAAPVPVERRRIEESTALFAGLIPTIHLRIDPAGIESLRKDPRTYVEGAIEEAGAKPCAHLGIKLKGSDGSLQDIDRRPSFSINSSKFKGGDRFHGLKHFHLNNAAEDESALNELVSGEMARAAGVPAARCTHALVSLNGRELGIYVLKEAFTQEFVGAFFKRTDGQLYEGAFLSEIDENMELDRGDESRNGPLLELIAAMREPDRARQFERVSSLVDVDAYLRYLALENILCHWDGYSFNRNNYRLYENPETGRFHFFLHGMDVMFGDPAESVQRYPSGVVGAILWGRPEIRERYWALLTDVFEKVFKVVDWPARVEEHGRRLAAALKPDAASEYTPHIADARRRVADRLTNVQQQIAGRRFVNRLPATEVLELGEAEWASQIENGESKEVNEDGKPCLYLQAKGDANLSWRLTIALPPGTYRFEAQMKTRRVDPLITDAGDGAGLSIAFESRKDRKFLQGDAGWQSMTFEIDSSGRDHTLVAELLARSGELWIDRKSLRLVRVP